MASSNLRFALTSVAMGVLLLAGCGGGGSDTVKTVQYSKSYAAGRISGFGSIVINSVHYDETSATVLDDDGVTHPSSDLKLGMVAEVQASDYGVVDNSSRGGSDQTTATAQTITFKSAVQGPVTSVDMATGAMTVLGQQISITSSTAFDTALAGGLSTINVGDIVKVYGVALTTGNGYQATRIEPVPAANVFALRGLVTTYDPVAQTINIGPTLIDVSMATLPDTLKVGSLVRFRLQTTSVNGAWIAINEQAGANQPQDNDHSELEGTITDYASVSSFSVDGTPVDARGVTLTGITTLAIGTRVKVQGAVVKGVLVATSMSAESDQAVQSEGFDIDGSLTAMDAAKSTFVVRGTTVGFSNVVSVVGGLLADLAVGSKVEVHGVLAADGNTLTATDIKIVQ